MQGRVCGCMRCMRDCNRVAATPSARAQRVKQRATAARETKCRRLQPRSSMKTIAPVRAVCPATRKQSSKRSATARRRQSSDKFAFDGK
jgi:hypothetical protein